jgi:hypothetical protein
MPHTYATLHDEAHVPEKVGALEEAQSSVLLGEAIEAGHRLVRGRHCETHRSTWEAGTLDSGDRSTSKPPCVLVVSSGRGGSAC